MTDLQYRILQISYANRRSHIGSCLTAVDILDEIYTQRKPDDPVYLGNGHAGLALYVVLEKHLGLDAEDLLRRHGVHPTKSISDGIYVSSGSLGQAETVAVGRALANRSRDVWLLSSDGGSAEGAFWEALAFKADNRLDNLHWFVAANGYGAYREIDVKALKRRINAFDSGVTVVTSECCNCLSLGGLNAHYTILTDVEYARYEAQWREQNLPDMRRDVLRDSEQS